VDHYLRTAQSATILLDPVRDPLVAPPPEPGVSPEAVTGYTEALAWFNAEYPVIVALVEQTMGSDLQTWELAWTLATFLDRRSLWQVMIATQHVARDVALRLADRYRLAQSERGLGRAYVRLGSYDEAAHHLSEALEGFRALGEPVFQAHAHLELVRLREVREDYEGALQQSELAHSLYRSVGYQVGQARAANNIGWHHARLGRYDQALHWCEQALAVHVEIANPHGQANTLDSLGYIHHHLGHIEQARDCFRQALTLFHELSDRFYTADTLTHLGDAELDDGNVSAALAAWRQALPILDELDHPAAQGVRDRIDKALPPENR
jgi:tetratricopeptide (TPR) repeat protein